MTTGVTTFQPRPLDGLLNTIDEHHGPYSSDPPYGRVEVIGEPLTGTARRSLAHLGFAQVVPTLTGFVATR